MTEKLRWGVLGTGSIATQFARAMIASEHGTLAAVGSRNLETALAFAQEHAVPAHYGAYDDLISDASIDAIYVATPHPSHHDLAIQAAGAGKHLLVEKPMTMNGAETRRVLDAVRRHDVFLMEAFMYRSHPQTDLLVDLIRDGAIGEVRLIESSFGFHAHFDPASRLFAPALGGGGILDVGCYAASMAVLLARAAGTAPDPLSVVGAGRLGTTGVDEWAAATIEFGDGVVAQLTTGVQLNLNNETRVSGSEGSLTVTSPWRPNIASPIVLRRPGRTDELKSAAGSAEVFTLEIDNVARNIAARQSPAMPWADTVATMSILDGWRTAIGLVYPDEAG